MQSAAPTSLLYRFKRFARRMLKSQAPVADGWKPAGGPVMVIAPHPDDEVIGCGGTMIRHALAGDPVDVIYLTRGGNSRGFPWLSAEQKMDTREAEARSSCLVLAAREAIFLNGPDGRLGEAEAMGELTAKIARLLAEKRPRMIYIPHARDNHADHVAAYRMLSAALMQARLPAPPEVWQYEVWSPLGAEVAVDVTAHMGRKIKALRKHRLALDAFDYVSTMKALAAYRSGTLLQRTGYAEAFRRTE